MDSIKSRVQKALASAGKLQRVTVDPSVRRATRPVLPAIAQRAPKFEKKGKRSAQLISPKKNKSQFYQTAPSVHSVHRIVKPAVTATETSATATEPSASAKEPSASAKVTSASTTETIRNLSASSSGSDILNKDLDLSESDNETLNIPVSLPYKEFESSEIKSVATKSTNRADSQIRPPSATTTVSNIVKATEQISATPSESQISAALADKSLPNLSISISTAELQTQHTAIQSENLHVTFSTAETNRPLLKILESYKLDGPPPIIDPIFPKFKPSNSLKNDEKNSVKTIAYKPYEPLIDQTSSLGKAPKAKVVERNLNAKQRHQMRRRERYLKKLEQTKIVYK